MAKQNIGRSQSAATVPVALSIAGSDSSAGAGIQADIKTFSALNVYGLTAVTCVVAEIPGKVSRLEPISPEMVREQIEVVAKSFPIAAIKTGLLCSAAIISAVARAIDSLASQLANPRGLSRLRRSAPAGSVVDLGCDIPLVVDPVITATGGDRLLDPDAIEAYQKELFPIASLITPNLDEAAQLLGETIRDRKSMERAGRELARRFKTAILLKGGHLSGKDAVDLLFLDGKVTEFSAPFVRDVATHGTGCTYSAAITAGLASGMSLEDSITRAKTFVTACITSRFRWKSNADGNIDALSHLPENP